MNNLLLTAVGFLTIGAIALILWLIDKFKKKDTQVEEDIIDVDEQIEELKEEPETIDEIEEIEDESNNN
jgi:hypothetical protein